MKRRNDLRSIMVVLKMICSSIPAAVSPVRRALAVASSAGLMVMLAASAPACSKTYIPNTDVEDTSQNRKIILVCEEYRHAVEERNVGQLLKLASPQYYEDGGNTNGSDDIDFGGLKDYLTSTFLKTQGIRYEIRYRRVTMTETNRVLIDYTYAGSYKLPGVKAEEWKHTVADNRLELVLDGDSYKIVAGM